MTRIILFSGKGGVGKTTAAAATALNIADQGQRVLLLSFDLAHSLRDAFGMTDSLLSHNPGQPVAVGSRLEFQEIDVYEELARDWEPVYRYVSGLMSHGGLDDALADELAVMPGLEDVAALITLHKSLTTKSHDVVVLDCPPTSSTLRFIGMASGLRWYAENRLKRERRLVKLVRPIARTFHKSGLYLPDDAFFEALDEIGGRLRLVEEALQDPRVTSARLVTIPEKMVVKETQRAFMYLAMYGIHVDLTLVNRLLTDEDPYFAEWSKTQATYLETIKRSFGAVPVVSIPLFREEIEGEAALRHFAGAAYGDRDAADFFCDGRPIRLIEEKGGTRCRLEVLMPFVEKNQIEIVRGHEDLTVRVGTFKRFLPLPRSIATYRTVDSHLEDGILTIEFEQQSEMGGRSE